MGGVIMAVDDSASVRRRVRSILEDEGFKVIEAEDGKDALAKLKGKVDMIFTDLIMPNMDGIEFIKEVRANTSYRFIPIVMLTTESQAERKRAGKSAGATGWIVKPFDPKQLIDVVRKVSR